MMHNGISYENTDALFVVEIVVKVSIPTILSSNIAAM